MFFCELPIVISLGFDSRLPLFSIELNCKKMLCDSKLPFQSSKLLSSESCALGWLNLN